MSRDARTYGWAGQSLPAPDYAVPIGDVGTGTAVVGLSKGIQLHPAMQAAMGSDMARITWADDGYQYCAFNDGNGWSGGTYVSYGITRIAGGPEGYTPTDLFYGPSGSGHGKIESLICIGGVMYYFLPQAPDNYLTWPLYKSTNHFATDGSATGVSFTTADTGFTSWRPIPCGQDYDDAPDSYLYFVGNPFDTTGPWYLARVPVASIETQGSYEVFSGTPASPAWTTTWANKTAILSGTGHSEFEVIYLSGPGCYLGVSGNVFGTDIAGPPDTAFEPMQFFTAPAPWGPYTLVASVTMPHPGLYGASPSVGRNFAPKWCAADGATIWMTYSGIWGWDCFNACECGVRLGPVSATWEDQDGGTTDLYAAVAKGEATDDTKYLVSPAGPTGETLTLQLGPITGTPSAVSTVLRMKRQA